MIKYSLDDSISFITLDRPEKRNALDKQMSKDLTAAFEQAKSDNPKIIFLTGEGTVFSAGADLDTALFDEEFLIGHLNLLRLMQEIETPIIGYINGPALGAGVQLAMACDYRIMDPSSKIGIPAAKIGVALDSWTIKKLVNCIGDSNARSILFGLDEINAERCSQIGFANKIGTKQDALNVASLMKLLAPLTFKHYKLVLNDDGSRDDPKQSHIEAMTKAWKSNDLQQGKQARITRQFPQFTGS